VSTTTVAANPDLQAFLYFLSACLRWDPAVRLRPIEALRHPWLRDGGHSAHALATLYTPPSSSLGDPRSDHSLASGPLLPVHSDREADRPAQASGAAAAAKAAATANARSSGGGRRPSLADALGLPTGAATQKQAEAADKPQAPREKRPSLVVTGSGKADATRAPVLTSTAALQVQPGPSPPAGQRPQAQLQQQQQQQLVRRGRQLSTGAEASPLAPLAKTQPAAVASGTPSTEGSKSRSARRASGASQQPEPTGKRVIAVGETADVASAASPPKGTMRGSLQPLPPGKRRSLQPDEGTAVAGGESKSDITTGQRSPKTGGHLAPIATAASAPVPAAPAPVMPGTPGNGVGAAAALVPALATVSLTTNAGGRQRRVSGPAQLTGRSQSGGDVAGGCW
jgi:hypothetical protein